MLRRMLAPHATDGACRMYAMQHALHGMAYKACMAYKAYKAYKVCCVPHVWVLPLAC